MLADGTVFETTKENSPLLLHAGEGETVEGLDKGITALGLEDKARLYISAPLAYGANRAGNKILAFLNLMFNVEVNKPNQK